VQKLDFAAITEHQKTCHAMLQASKSSSLQLQAVEVMGVSLWWDISTGVPRPVTVYRWTIGGQFSTSSTVWPTREHVLLAASWQPGWCGAA
jgi:hypothetical protein